MLIMLSSERMIANDYDNHCDKTGMRDYQKTGQDEY